MSTPGRPTVIDATAAVPIDVASKVAMTVMEWQRQLAACAARLRLRAERARLWVDRQHFTTDHYVQLAIVGVYLLVSIVEALGGYRRGR